MVFFELLFLLFLEEFLIFGLFFLATFALLFFKLFLLRQKHFLLDPLLLFFFEPFLLLACSLNLSQALLFCRFCEGLRLGLLLFAELFGFLDLGVRGRHGLG